MHAIELVAVAIGLGALIAIVVMSLRGPRDPGGRLPSNGGPVIPGHSYLLDGDDDDHGA